VLHRVILPAPAAKRARSSLKLQLRRMMTRFLLFHQSQDTADCLCPAFVAKHSCLLCR